MRDPEAVRVLRSRPTGVGLAILIRLVVFAGLTSGCAGPAQSSHPESSGGPPAESEQLRILHDWDRQRAHAWAEADRAALARLYRPGSDAGSRDLALLDSYRARGFRVVDLRMQITAIRTLVRRPRLLRIEVVDRLAGAVAIRGQERHPLPSVLPSRRMLTLQRVDGRWVMVRVEQE